MVRKAWPSEFPNLATRERAHTHRAHTPHARGAVSAGCNCDEHAGDYHEGRVVSSPLVLRLCDEQSFSCWARAERESEGRRAHVYGKLCAYIYAGQWCESCQRTLRINNSRAHAHNTGRETQVQHLPQRQLQVHLSPLSGQ